jgi:hypothetical protein
MAYLTVSHFPQFLSNNILELAFEGISFEGTRFEGTLT